MGRGVDPPFVSIGWLDVISSLVHKFYKSKIMIRLNNSGDRNHLESSGNEAIWVRSARILVDFSIF